MKTADSFDRHNSAVVDHLPCISDGIPAPFASADQIHFRSAIVAAHRLCIIPPRLRIIIFFRTIRTHRKFFHAGALPVIGQRIQYGQPGTAAGTVDKRMQIPPVLRIIQFLFTLITDRNIRRNKDLPLCFFAFYNVKIRKLRYLLCRNLFRIYF